MEGLSLLSPGIPLKVLEATQRKVYIYMQNSSHLKVDVVYYLLLKVGELNIVKYVHLTNFALKQVSRTCKPEGEIYPSEEPGFIILTSMYY